MTTVIIVICAYLIGAIPSGVVLTRLAGAEDVRSAGAAGVIYRHKENIRRLRDGSENRFK